MKRAILGAAAAALLAPAGQAQTTGWPVEVVDHVAILVVKRTGPLRFEQDIITRSGARQRRDQTSNNASYSEYSDFARGVTVSVGRWSGGGEFLMASEREVVGTGVTMREKTGETQRWAGETCDMWASWGADRRGQFASLSCLTHDGIELWQGWRSSTGEVSETFHAMVVQRRPVAPEEVRLPASALDWARWREGAEKGDVSRGYEVTLAGDGSEITTRTRGGWMVEDSRFMRGARSFVLKHARATLSFNNNGRARYLSLFRNRPASGEAVFGKPVPLGREAVIVGRPCVWYNMTPDLHDANSSECRDAEDIVLARHQTGWGGGVTLSVTATRFSGRPAAEGAFTPPPEAFSWVLD